ncbi:MAG: hypothetical protein KME32_26995 [Mojavia pulchra JT2-VF2]|uniref:Uncharacterized protein n=1 Tax=Mojavia pulchra JT2-VF2 TaxID=287848 RepID=A0A951Q2P7_9NOST|nr:hypothetical protein [Mojavia pulchra JT2-VF2]
MALLINGMNFVSRKGKPVRWAAFPTCRHPEGSFPQGSNWRRKGANN